MSETSKPASDPVEANYQPVRRRAVFYIGGYDPKSSQAFYERLEREAGRYETLWHRSVTLEDDDTNDVLNGQVTRRRYRTLDAHTDDGTGEGEVETVFHHMSVDDIVLADFNRPFLSRLGRYCVTFADYVISGTAFSFMRHAWRFAIYFFYPAAMLAIAIAASFAVAWLMASTGVALSWLTAPVFFIAVFSAFVQMVFKRYFVLHLMDLWSFSRDFLRREQPAIDDQLEHLARHIVEAARAGKFDEIVMVGHSTGGALILDAAWRALDKDPGFAGRSGATSLLTVGSTALKIGLHPRAGWFRQRVSEIVAQPSLDWAEYQCITDIINFEGTDPAALMGTIVDPPKPVVNRIRIKNMLDPKTYKRIRRNFFRVHYQFVFGNTRPAHYDFPAICFGAMPLKFRSQNRRMAGAIAHHAQSRTSVDPSAIQGEQA